MAGTISNTCLILQVYSRSDVLTSPLYLRPSAADSSLVEIEHLHSYSSLALIPNSRIRETTSASKRSSACTTLMPMLRHLGESIDRGARIGNECTRCRTMSEMGGHLRNREFAVSVRVLLVGEGTAQS
jgi:hypothetical protein